MKRMDIDTMMMQIAEICAQRSTCLRRKVGAVLTRKGMVISTGYNGAPKKVKSCLETGVCMREGVKSGTKLEYCLAAHAEHNAIVQAANLGHSTEDTIIYSIYQPCSFCAKSIINAGIKEVVYIEDYPDELALKMLKEADVKLRKMEGYKSIIVLKNLCLSKNISIQEFETQYKAFYEEPPRF